MLEKDFHRYDSHRFIDGFRLFITLLYLLLMFDYLLVLLGVDNEGHLIFISLILNLCLPLLILVCLVSIMKMSIVAVEMVFIT